MGTRYKNLKYSYQIGLHFKDIKWLGADTDKLKYFLETKVQNTSFLTIFEKNKQSQK